jgi:hypothetical protein
MLRFLILPAGDLLVSSVIALRPVAFWRLIALGLHAWLTLYFIQVSTGSSAQEYFTRTAVATKFFIAYHLIWLTDPLVDYRHELDKIPPSERSFVYRMYWAMCILVNARRVGLNSPVNKGFLLCISECSHFRSSFHIPLPLQKKLGGVSFVVVFGEHLDSSSL